MALDLRILYRGPLSSCNYDCHYCPFAKCHESAAELRRDREALERFARWVQEQTDCRLSVLFTPWGEALTRPWYRDAITQLGHLPHVAKVAIQTNLSCPTDWLDQVNRDTTALWCTWHPSQVSRQQFLAQCGQLARRGIRFSVGMVGLHEAFDEIDALRADLPRDVYLWINAYKDQPNYYSPEQVERLERVDPLFRINNARHPSRNEACTAGETAVSIDGDGNLRRCHFVGHVVGNIYEPNWQASLARRPCPNETCGCYIGYMFMPRMQHDLMFGDGLLERIPAAAIWEDPAQRAEAQAFARSLVADRNAETFNVEV